MSSVVETVEAGVARSMVTPKIAESYAASRTSDDIDAHIGRDTGEGLEADVEVAEEGIDNRMLGRVVVDIGVARPQDGRYRHKAHFAMEENRDVPLRTEVEMPYCFRAEEVADAGSGVLVVGVHGDIQEVGKSHTPVEKSDTRTTFPVRFRAYKGLHEFEPKGVVDVERAEIEERIDGILKNAKRGARFEAELHSFREDEMKAKRLL